MATQDWSSLIAVAKFLQRLGVVLLAAGVGAWVGSVTLAALTFYVYFIGIFLGLPLGLLIGGYCGFVRPARDTAYVFSGTVFAWVLPNWLAGSAKGEGSDLFAVVIPAIVSASFAFLLIGTINLVPIELKKWAGVLGTASVFTWWGIRFLIHIYSA